MIELNFALFLVIAGLAVVALLFIQKLKHRKAERQQEFKEYEDKLCRIITSVGATANVNMLKEIALNLYKIEQQLKRIQ